MEWGLKTMHGMGSKKYVWNGIPEYLWNGAPNVCMEWDLGEQLTYEQYA